MSWISLFIVCLSSSVISLHLCDVCLGTRFYHLSFYSALLVCLSICFLLSWKSWIRLEWELHLRESVQSGVWMGVWRSLSAASPSCHRLEMEMCFQSARMLESITERLKRNTGMCVCVCVFRGGSAKCRRVTQLLSQPTSQTMFLWARTHPKYRTITKTKHLQSKHLCVCVFLFFLFARVCLHHLYNFSVCVSGH